MTASCTYAEAGYDCDGNCLVDSDGDAICDQDEVTGCQDSTACNYDVNATDAGYCVYADAGYDCDGNCVSDTDGDGVCDEFETAGCTDSALHVITIPGQQTTTVRARMPRLATTAMATALVDSDGDQICDQDEVTGCQDSAACNYDVNATDAGYCDYADGGYDCDGNCLNDSDRRWYL